METTREKLQNQIDAAYDCDQPHLVETLEAQLKTLPLDAAEPTDPMVDPYAAFRDENGNVDSAKVFGVKE